MSFLQVYLPNHKGNWYHDQFEQRCDIVVAYYPEDFGVLDDDGSEDESGSFGSRSEGPW